MYLKEIVIDGFKSYATRTVVRDFDPAFNAITGLNGSGKSNVLDSICFVLGITNLSQVRAASLQDLVYKGGLAGVRKATVCLVFDNTEKSTSPVGYEQSNEITVTRQIVVGGKSKYLINGTNSQTARVHNLFHSVGLNVNNPHFLIMQGRITKVINMKPPEVLSMIEEAAGTKMYENKKEGALRTMDKKQRKVDEINALLEDKINPSLAKLEREREHYVEWNQNNNETEALKRYLVAHRYFNAKYLLEQSSSQNSELHAKAEQIVDSTEQLKEQQTASKKRLDDMVRDHSAREESGDLEDKQQHVDSLSKKLVKLKSAWVNQQSALKEEDAALKELEKNLEEQTAKAATLKDDVAKAQDAIHPAEEKQRKAALDLENAEAAILTGAASQGGQGSGAGTGSLIDQLQTARHEASVAQTQFEELQGQKSHLEREYEHKSVQLAQDRSSVRVLTEKKKDAEKAVNDARIAVHALDFDGVEAERLNAQLTEERNTVAQLADKYDALAARLESCEFRFSDPHAGFDRRKVHGLVARLIAVKDARMTTAIEVTAGGRLFQVVVDSDGTAKELLHKGRLARRVTILPLNKIRHDVLADAKLHSAKSIEPSTELALSLVGYDHEVSNAIEHVFGRTLVCPDMNTAKRVTFDNRVRTRTVTLEGDTYDPSGTASGGSSGRHGPSILTQLGELRDVEVRLATHRANVERLSAEVGRVNQRAEQFERLQAQLEMKKEEGERLERQLAETATGRLITEVAALEAKLAEVKEGMSQAKAEKKTQQEKCAELERLMQGSEAAKKREKERAEAAMAAVRTARDTAAAELQGAKDRHAELAIELETTEEEVKRLELKISGSARPSVEKLRADVERAESKVGEVKETFDKEDAELKQKREQILSSNRAIAEARREHEEIGERVESLSLEKAHIDSKLRENERGRSGAEKLVQDLDAQHPWIEQEREQFGVEGSEYEFSDARYATSKRSLEQLEQRQDALSKRINKKAMIMFETAKDEYNNLMRKKAITEQDKEKIELVITKLDERKMVAVEHTWRKVNADFGSIFSDLLPGTSAKLEPPEGGSVEDGLEIRVAFGTVWKDSLSELSGGQRSLIALSLILAMLRFKPAPLYILDEVDAALDLSHTQNIGRMLRKHFSNSQFIVVSLKEGMFSNANVLFRTKFVDGVSTINRTANNRVNDDDDNDNDIGRRALGQRRAGSASNRNNATSSSISRIPMSELDKENVI